MSSPSKQPAQPESQEDEFQRPRWQVKAERRKERKETQVSLSLSTSRAHPLSLFDLQNFVLWVLSENFGVLPRWCVVQNKHIVSSIHCLVLSPEFEPIVDKSFLNEVSDSALATSAPFFAAAVTRGCVLGLRGHSNVLDAFLQVPLPAKALLEFETLKHAKRPIPDAEEPPTKRPRVQAETEAAHEGAQADLAVDSAEAAAASVPIDPREFLLSEAELRAHRYPLPLEDGLLPRGFVGVSCLTASQTVSSEPATDEGRVHLSTFSGCRLLGVDCEMVQTEEGLELARVSVVDESLATVLDLYVRPTSLVVDYLTKHSGITAEHLKSAVSFSHAQSAVLELLRPRRTGTDADTQQEEEEEVILVGHSLENDLNALKIVHMKVMDTAVLYPHPRGLPAKNSLAMLALKVLNVKMDRATGHCSADDARIALRVAMKKLQRGKGYNPSLGVSRVVGFEEVLVGRVSVLGSDAKEDEAGSATKEQQGDVGESGLGGGGRLVVREVRPRGGSEGVKREDLLKDADEQIRRVVDELEENAVVMVFGGADDAMEKLEKLGSLLEKCEDTNMRGEIKKRMETTKTRANDGFAVIAVAQEIKIARDGR